VLFALLADILFYHHPWGINAALFAALLWLSLMVRNPSAVRPRTGMRRLEWGWAILAAGALAALAEEPSPLAVVMAALCLGTLVLAAGRDLERRFLAWVSKWVYLLGTLFLRPLLDSQIGARWQRRHPHARAWLGRVFVAIAWWILPLAAGAGFVLLFAVANPIIDRWVHAIVENLWLLLDWLPLALAPQRFALWVAVALGTYGLLRYRRVRIIRREAVAVPPVVRPPQREWRNRQGIIVRCLVVFNAVFAVQSGLDLIYLYGGAALPAGMTYAQYAHRGAYPLVATALLAGLFVIAAFRAGDATRNRLAHGLVYFWIAQNGFLLFSTIFRLWLYVDAYSLTRLRLSAMVWVALVAAGFAWIIVRIATGRGNAWLWRMNVLTLFGVLYLCAFVNIDGIIARFNVEHCLEIDGRGAPIDIAYLRELGPEALPAIDWLIAQGKLPPPERSDLAAAETSLRTELGAELVDWRGWTFRRWREASSEQRHASIASLQGVH
jgi:hypothetical protein